MYRKIAGRVLVLLGNVWAATFASAVADWAASRADHHSARNVGSTTDRWLYGYRSDS